MKSFQDSAPEVTIVIATYNRPEVLSKTIESVLHQTTPRWVLYVMGDRCDESTRVMMDRFSDKRIVYYNSPFRAGSQSAGNSIGIALAKTPYLAFLNHDDLWTPDHLEVALSALKASGDDFYIGRSVHTRDTVNGIPQLEFANPPDRSPLWFFMGYTMLIEPCSTWVVETATAPARIATWGRNTTIF